MIEYDLKVNLGGDGGMRIMFQSVEGTNTDSANVERCFVSIDTELTTRYYLSHGTRTSYAGKLSIPQANEMHIKYHVAGDTLKGYVNNVLYRTVNLDWLHDNIRMALHVWGNPIPHSHTLSNLKVYEV